MQLGAKGAGHLESLAWMLNRLRGPLGDGVARRLLSEGVNAVGAMSGGIFILDEAGSNLELKTAVQFPEPLADRYRLIPLSAKVPLVDSVKTMQPAFLESLEDYVASYPEYARMHPQIAQNGFVALPVAIDGHCVGAIALGFATPRSFTPGERDYLVLFATQCANALERVHHLDLYEASRHLAEHASQRLERLSAFTGALAQAIAQPQVVETVVDMGLAATLARSVELWMLSQDGGSAILIRHVGPEGVGSEGLIRLPIDPQTHLPVVDALRNGTTVWIESHSQLDERFPNVETSPDSGEESVACLPLLAQGRCIGCLAYSFDGIHRFLDDERAFLQVLAWYSAQALERARLYAAEKEARERAEVNQRRSDFIADIGMLLSSSTDYSSILSEVVEATVPRFADSCLLELVDQRLGGTAPIARHADPSKVPLLLELGRRLSGLNDFHERLAADEKLQELADQIGIASSLTVRVSARGQALGAIVLGRAGTRPPYDAHDQAAAEELARRVGLALDNARLYGEALDADRMKDEFLAMLSHELRNPLAPIVTALQLMESGGEQAFPRERAIISRHVRQVVRLVEDLLDVASIKHGKLQLVKERCELPSIVATAVEMATPLLEKRAHRLSTSIEHGLQLIGDRARLTQAIANLLTNAAKYTEPGGEIAIGAAADGPSVVVRVRDSGAGIAAHVLPRIFDLFVQGASPLDRSQGGLGVGLMVVKNVVGLHGGTVSAHSAGLGHGSEFVIRLPRATLDVAVLAASSDDVPGTARHRHRVLAVDDNHDAVELLAKALEGFGCSVHVVHDGASAIASLATFNPELVLLDIGLPGMDGYEVARRLRESNLPPSSKIIALTGYGQPSDRLRSQEAGFDDHLVKPVRIETLRRILDSTFHSFQE